MSNGLAIGILGIGLALPLAVAARSEGDDSREVVRTGEVVELAPLLADRGVVADEEAIAGELVLEGDDGMVVPLLPSPASRALYLDDRLRDRPAEVKGLIREGLPYLEVLSFRVEERGSLRTPEYFCEICAISARYPQTCPCCQGSMELRFKPDSGRP